MSAKVFAMGIRFEKSVFIDDQIDKGEVHSGQSVSLNDPGIVRLHAHPEQVETALKNGDDLIITIDGDEIIIEDFYLDEANEVQFLSDDGGMLWETSVYPSQSSGFVPMDFIPVGADGSAIISLTAAASDGVAYGLWAGAGLLVVGAGATLAGGGGGSSSSSGDPGKDKEEAVAGDVFINVPVETPSDEGDNTDVLPRVASSSDSGISGDRITSDSTPTIVGSSGMVGDTVVLYGPDAVSVLGRGAVDADGEWMVTPYEALQDGIYDLFIGFVDDSGEARPTHETFTLTIDSTCPEPASAAPTLVATSDPGATNDGMTNDSTPTFVGAGANPNDTVTLYAADGTVLASVPVAADGTWSVTCDIPLTDGPHELAISFTDVAGNESALSPIQSLMIDTSAPTNASPGPALDTDSDSSTLGDGITRETTPVLRGEGAASGDTVTLYDTDSLSSLGTGVVQADGTWSVSPDSPLGDGSYSLGVTYTDPAGNESELTATVSIIVDTTPPADPLASPTLDTASDTGSPGDGMTSDTTPTFIGAGATPNDTVILYDTGGITILGSAIVSADGSWSVSPDAALADGSYDLSVSYTDAAGNESALSPATSVRVDTTAPGTPASAPILAPASDSGIENDNITSDHAPALTGSGAVPGDSVTLYNGDGTSVLGSAVVEADGRWSVTPESPLANGSYGFRVSYSDNAGNESDLSAMTTITIDSIAPNAAVSAPVLDDYSDSGIKGDAITSDTVPTLTGSGGTPGETVRLYHGDGETVIGVAMVQPDSTWSVTPDAPLAEGTHNLTVSYSDAAGNESTHSPAVSLVIDTVSATGPASAPSLASTSDTAVEGDGITADTTPTFVGADAPIDHVVTLYDANTGEALGAISVGPDGTWSITPDAPLADGRYDLNVTYTDQAGNESSPSPTTAVVIDVTAPVAPTLALMEDTGADSGDGISSNGEMQISGIESGASWEYSVDGGSAWTAGTGDHLMLGSGEYGPGQVQVRQTDAAGNPGPSGGNSTTIRIANVYVEQETASIAEPDLSAGPATVAGRVGLGDPDGDPVSVSLSAPAETFSVKGETISWSGEGTGVLVGSTSVGEAVRINVDTDGNYTVTLSQALDHPVANNADHLNLDIGVSATDGTNTTSGTLSVSVIDDMPVVEANNLFFSVGSSLPDTIVGDALGAGGSYGGDDGSVTQVQLGGLNFTYDNASNSVAPPSGSSHTVTNYSYDDYAHELTIDTVFGETVVVDMLNAEFSYTASGVSGVTNTINEAPVVSGDSGFNPGLLGGDVLGLIDLSEDQPAGVFDGDNNLDSVSLSYEAVGLTTGLSFAASSTLAQELGIDVITTTNAGLLVSTASISFSANDGGVLDLLKVNELLGTVTFDPGLVSAGLTSTVTLSATDVMGASGSESSSGLLDVNLLNLNLIDTSPASTIQEGDSADNTLSGDGQVSKGDRLYGHGGNDTLNGGTGNDILRGGTGDDRLQGGDGNDILIGGAGADQLTGDAGSDVFRWEADDESAPGTPTVDTVQDFGADPLSAGGDVIDLADLLQGEGAVGTHPGNLSNYLHFEYDGIDTTLHISSTGNFAGGYDGALADQQIVFNEIDLVNGSTTDSDIIDGLLASGQLIVDQATSSTVFTGGYTDLGITIADGDGDTQHVDIRFDQSGLEAPAPTSNVAPDVQQGDGALLGLAGVSSLNLIDFSRQGLNASDRDGNLQVVTIDYTPLVDIDLGGLGSSPTLTYSQAIADELGLQVEAVNDPGLLGLVLPSSKLTVTAADGGNLDNVEINEFLASVTFDQDIGLLSNIAQVEVLNATTITATDDLNASASSSVGDLIGVSLLNVSGDLIEADSGDNTVAGTVTDDRIYGFDGNDVLSGDDGNDLIRGGAGNDWLSGGAGGDILIAGAGADILSGGSGDDYLVINDANFVSVDGGEGFDTLQLDEGINLDLLNPATGSISNIERINLVKGDAGTTLSLTEDLIEALTDTHDEIQIMGDNGDALVLTGATLEESSVEMSGAIYDIYAFGSATMMVETDVEVVM
ncbi:Ig-like domain-containing protein [Marinobacter fonticola]|uniref:Ig-like domain-containing protein n=1 Tax=Marinobacter fonticola TaxID=2603215 RepID=UPI00143CF421|nr:Ig-like domain-containing protein [Marinobacter fonticola]